MSVWSMLTWGERLRAFCGFVLLGAGALLELVVLALAAAALLVWLSAPGYGQQNVVYDFPLQGVTTAPSSSPAIPNFGQSQHQLFIRLESRPSLTCAAQNIDVALEAGVPDSAAPSTIRWRRVGQPAVAADGVSPNIVARAYANGVFPHIRATASAFNATNCALYATYTGSFNPATFNEFAGSGAQGIAGTGLISIPIDYTASSDPHAQLVSSYANTCAASARRLCVHGLSLTVENDAEVRIKNINDTTTNGTFLKVGFVASRAQFLLPQFGTPWACSAIEGGAQAVDGLVVWTDVAAGNAGVVSGVVIMRCTSEGP